MKVEVLEKKGLKQTETKFPCIMKSPTTGLVVLFTKMGEGIIVDIGSSDVRGRKLGNLEDGFGMIWFEDFDAEIKFSNE